MVREITSAPLTTTERARFAALAAEKGWTRHDLQLLALRHVDETGSKSPARIVRHLLRAAS